MQCSGLTSSLYVAAALALSTALPAPAAASICDSPRAEWLMCEDFEGAAAGFGEWFAESAFVECRGCSDGRNDPNRLFLSDDADHVFDGSYGLHMPAAAAADYQGAELIFRSCAGDPRTGCDLTNYERLYLRTRVKLAPDHEYVHHFLSIGGTRPNAYWEGSGNAGCRPNGYRHAGTTVDFDRERRLFFYTYFPDMRCDSGGYCSGSYVANICDGCAGKDMPCDSGPECCWGNRFEPEPRVQMPRGEWVCLEMMMQINTPGVADGEMAFWVNDTLAHRVTDMHWRDVAELGLNRANMSHYIARSDAERPNRVSFDDFIVSTERIGCDMTPEPEPDPDPDPDPEPGRDGGLSGAADGGGASGGPDGGGAASGSDAGTGGRRLPATETANGCSAAGAGASPVLALALLLSLSLLRRRWRSVAAASVALSLLIASACTGQMSAGELDADVMPAPDAETVRDGAVVPGTDGGLPPTAPDGGALPSTDWPVPIPGAPGTGPACAEPLQAPPGDDWPEVFVGVEGCDDGGEGTRATPFCTFERAFEVADSVPFIVTVRDGVYRQRGHRLIRAGSADAYFMVRAEEGARPVVLGSEPLGGATFEDVGDGTFRADVSDLGQDPTGLWTSGGRRIIHVMEFREGSRSHAPAADLEEPGTWTKADAAGAACDSDNAGCYVYVRPFADMDVAATDFEASQGSFLYAGGSDFMVIEGMSTRFTQSTAVFFEGARNIVLQDGDFAHNANGNDNSYNLRLWGADGAIVRRNRVSDSRYWGGAVNSHGITFMITGADDDIWVCQNEVFDTVGGGVSTKSGSSHVHVVGNWLHDLGAGVRIPGPRCHWRGCDERLWPSGAYDIRENLFERCGDGVAVEDRAAGEDPDVMPSTIYNNLFLETDRGVHVARVSTMPLVRNNLFLGGQSGLYFTAGGTDTWPDYYLGRGFDSAHNLFAGDDAVYVQANWSGTERGFTLADYRAEYGSEAGSLEADPDLDDRYRPNDGSPARGAGDPSPYDRPGPVHIGLWPFSE